MKKYESYKDSGIEWIGEVPEHWEIKKLKFVSEIIMGKMLTPEKKDGYILKPYLRAQNIKWFKTNPKDIKEMWFSAIELTKLRLQKGDLLVSEGGEVGRTCIWDNELNECYIQNSVHKVTLREGHNPFYYLCLFFLYGHRGVFDSIVSRVSIAHLTGEKLKEVIFICPPAEEQLAISAFLETKISQIDSLIQKKQKMIALLEEEKTAVISEAVTRGLNPDAPMKDSGIEWLGMIPEHWKIGKLKFLSSKISDGIHTTPSYVDLSDIYFINGINLNNGKITITSGTRCVNEEEYLKHKINLTKGTILLSLNGTIGKLAFYNEEKVILGKSAAYIECKKGLLNKFAYYFLQTTFVENYFSESFSGSTINNLSLYTLRNTPIAVPSVEEQEMIVQHIEEKCQELETTSKALVKELELLQEYRTSLISEAVTGKIDVRDYQPEQTLSPVLTE